MIQDFGPLNISVGLHVFQRNFQHLSHNAMQLVHSFHSTAQNQKDENLKHAINAKKYSCCNYYLFVVIMARDCRHTAGFHWSFTLLKKLKERGLF